MSMETFGVKGALYAVGGMYLSSTERFIGGSWVSGPAMSSVRSHLGLATHDGFLCALGGNSEAPPQSRSERLASVECLTGGIGSTEWKNTTTMPDSRWGFGAANLDGDLYVAGGYASNGFVNKVQRLNSKDGLWETMPSMLSVRYMTVLAAYNGLLYAAGGLDGNVKAVSTVERLNLESNAWGFVASLSGPRCGMGLAAWDGALYAVGGGTDNGSGSLSTVERFYATWTMWQVMPPMLIARQWPGVVAYDGALYAVGGRGSIEPYIYSSVERFGGIGWEFVASMETGRWGLAVAVFGGEIPEPTSPTTPDPIQPEFTAVAQESKMIFSTAVESKEIFLTAAERPPKRTRSAKSTHIKADLDWIYGQSVPKIKGKNKWKVKKLVFSKNTENQKITVHEIPQPKNAFLIENLPAIAAVAFDLGQAAASAAASKTFAVDEGASEQTTTDVMEEVSESAV